MNQSSLDIQEEAPPDRAAVGGLCYRKVSAHQSLDELRLEGCISVGASTDLADKMRGRHAPRQSRSTTASEGQNYITSLVEDLQWALTELGYGNDVKLSQIETLALFLHGVLTQDDARKFHDVVHLYEISAGASPLQFLAAAFRDVVRYYCNGETGPREAGVVDGVVICNSAGATSSSLTGSARQEVILSPDLKDERDLLVANIFGFEVGKLIRETSCNGHQYKNVDLLLSAVCAVRMFGDLGMSAKHSAQVAACLEATIPFRVAETAGGPTPCETLFRRLSACNDEHDLQMSEEELVETIQQAVDLRNRTVGNMVTDDISEFLDHTWNLLPERNACLRRRTLHTLSEYYGAICSMLEIVKGIEPHAVYGSFRGVPTDSDIVRFREALTRNLCMVFAYVRARLLAVATVMAFATLTGGADAPKCFFFGDLPSFHKESERLGEGLVSRGALEDTNTGKYGAEVYDLLRGDRMSETGFDTRNAPLAAYIYRELKDDMMLAEYEKLYAFPMETEDAWKLLCALPLNLAQTVGCEVGRIAISRGRSICFVLKELESKAIKRR